MEKRGSGRGFAALSKEEVSRLARLGGIRAHQAGTAHEWTSAEARDAGRKGGLAYKKRMEVAKIQEDLDNPIPFVLAAPEVES